MDQEAERLQGRIPSGGGGGGAPKAAAPAAAPAKPLFQRAGEYARKQGVTEINRGIAGLNTSLAAATAPVRAGIDAGAQLRAGFTRSAAPAPVQSPTLPSVVDSAAPPVAGGGSTVQAPARRVRGGAPMATSFDRSRPAAPAAAPAPAVAGPRPGDPNTITYSDGRTVDVSGMAGTPMLTRGQAPAAAAPQPRAANFDPVAAVQPAVAGQQRVANFVRGGVSGGLKPGSAQDELMRRAQHSQDSYFNKGSPSARAAMAAAYQGQMGALTQASSQFQRDANAALGAGAAGAIRQGLDAQAIDGQAQLKRMDVEGDLALEQVRQDAPGTVVGDDRVIRFRRGSTATPVMDENGQPVRAPAAQQGGALTPQDLLKAYTAEREAIAGSLGTADEKAAALAALDANPLFAPLTGQGAGPAAPAVGTEQDGYRFLGGDPANPESWEKL